MTYEYEQYLAHHGIKGQKWGIRRYQNEDGSLTEEGEKRYGRLSEKMDKAIAAYNDASIKAQSHSVYHPAHDNMERWNRKADKAIKKYSKFESQIDKDKYVRNKYGEEHINRYLEDERKNDENYKKFYDHASKQKKYQGFIGDRKYISVSQIMDDFSDTKKGRQYREKYNDFIDTMLNDKISASWYTDPRRYKN